MSDARPNFFDFDVTKMFADFRFRPFDVEAIWAAQRRNIEALTQANQLALEGTQALIRRNMELARQGMEELQSMMSDLTRPNGSMEDRLARQADFSKKAIEKGLANFREMADLMTKANTEAMNVLTKRVTESLEEVRDYTTKAA